MNAKLVFLGTGGSVGVPVLGCLCETCLSVEPKNKRLRSSALIHYDGQIFLIDSGPDFRQQGLKHSLHSLNGVLFTHAHYDHTAGLDDLRPLLFRRDSPLPALMSEATYVYIQTLFAYFFKASASKLDVSLLPALRGDYKLLNLPLTYFTYSQGNMPVNGFRFGNLAYVSDIKEFPETIFDDLAGVHTLILSALRHSYSPLHFTVDEAISFSLKCGAVETYLTHTSHELEYSITETYLPSNIHMAYDNLEIFFKV